MPPGSDCCRACPSDRGSAPAVSSPRSGRAAPADLAGPKARYACNLTPTCPRPAHPLAPSQETHASCASSARRCEDRVPVAARDAGRVASARQLPARSRSPAVLRDGQVAGPRCARGGRGFIEAGDIRRRAHADRTRKAGRGCQALVGVPGRIVPALPQRGKWGDATGGSVPLAKRCCATTHRLPYL